MAFSVSPICRDELRARHALLVLRRAIAAANEHRVFLHVARPDLDAQRHTLAHPLPDLLAAALVALVDEHAYRGVGIALRTELRGDLAAVLEHARLLVVGAKNRDDHDVLRREPRRQHEAVVVGVRHQQGRRSGASSRPSSWSMRAAARRSGRGTECRSRARSSAPGSGSCPPAALCDPASSLRCRTSARRRGSARPPSSRP